MKTYKKPLLVAVVGTIAPLTLGFALALWSHRPQCPEQVTQAQIDSGSCIIGADMSLLWVFLAVPVVLLSLVVASVWAMVLKQRTRV